MALFNYAQLEGLWIRAGGARAVAPVAAAIALAESGGNSGANNPHDSNGRGGEQFSGGLWGISNGTTSPPAGWADPAANARLAVAKYKGAGNSFRPWGSFTSRAYLRFLSGKTTPDLNVPAGGGGQGAGGGGSGGSADTCAWQVGFGGIPGTSWLADIFGQGGNIGSGEVCLLSKTATRAMLGGAIAVGGALILGTGFALVLASTGLRKAGPVLIALTGGAGKAAAAAGAAERHTRPGERISSSERATATANRKQLERDRKEAAAAATEQPEPVNA